MRSTAGTRLVLAMTCLALIALPTRAEPSGAAPAKAKAEYAPPSWPTAPTETALLTRLAVMTLLTLLIAGVVLYFIRRASRVPGVASGKNAPITVVESTSLGSGCTLHLLQVEQGFVVVGADRSGLKSIVPIEQFEDFLAEG